MKRGPDTMSMPRVLAPCLGVRKIARGVNCHLDHCVKCPRHTYDTNAITIRPRIRASYPDGASGLPVWFCPDEPPRVQGRSVAQIENHASGEKFKTVTELVGALCVVVGLLVLVWGIA